MAENAFKADWTSFALGFNTGKKKGGDKTVIDVLELPTENIEQDKIYRVTERSPEYIEVYIASGGQSYNLAGFYQFFNDYVGDGQMNGNGILPTVLYEAVDTVPTIEDIPAEYLFPRVANYTETWTGKCFILKSTGEPYIGVQGGGVLSVPSMISDGFGLPATFTGFIDSPETIPSGNVVATFYVPGGESIAFGIPDEADNKTLYEHNGSEWVECKAGGVELNIAYGDTPPEDTTKLWVKTAEPNGVVIGKGKHGGVLAEKMPNIHSESGSAKIGSKIYAFGGRGSDSSDVKFATCFDAETETSVAIPKTPFSQWDVGAVPFGSKVYLFGGSGSAKIYVFDTDTYAYEELSAVMAEARGGPGCEIVGSKVYLFGGYSENYNSPKKTVHRFDIETNEYNILDITLRSTTANPASVSVGNKIYVFGGNYDTYGQSRVYAYCFDADTETLTNLKNLPQGFGGAACVEVGGYIYIIGGVGYSNGSIRLNTVYRYDIENNEYILTDLTISEAKCSMFCEEVNGNIYLFGGKRLNAAGTYKNDMIELLTIPPQVKEGFLHLVTKEGATEVTAVSSDVLTVVAPVSDAYLGNSVGVGESVEACVYKDGEWAPI